MISKKLIVNITAILSLLAFPVISIAADGDSANLIEEVTVTARKREENLLDIAETITAISATDIDRQNIKTLDDIGLLIPNLNLSMRADGFPNVSIRGLGSFGNTQGVGFYLDDVQLFSDASSRFGDLERIEVLKGPQGVLFGGSNIGGAVKYVSKRPSADENTIKVKVLAGDQNILDTEISANVGLGENGWAMRLFGFTREDDGYLTNPRTPRLNGLRSNADPNAGAYDEEGFRLALEGPISDSASLYFTYRRNTTNRKDKRGLPLPRKSTINHEIYTIRRAYEIIGISKRYINRNQKPLKPKANMRISTKETQDVRQSMFDTTEWQALLTAGKHWYAKGLSRFDRNGDLLGFEEYKKDYKGGKKGELNYNKPIRRSVIFGDSKSARAIAQALPRPLPAPVTTAVLFFKLYFFKNILYE